MRRGWYLGGEAFRREWLPQVAEKRGAWHCGSELAELVEAKAGRRIAQALKARGWTAVHLAQERKGDGFQVGLAAKLRAETTVTVGWIAKRLQMGTRGYLTHLLYRHAHEAPGNSRQGQLWK